MIFSGVLEKLPNLRIAFAHGGGEFPATIGRIEHGLNVRPDLVAFDNPVNPREYLNRMYFDSLVHSPEMLRFLVNLVGAERVCARYGLPLSARRIRTGKIDRVNGL